jgi:hypothetical protein
MARTIHNRLEITTQRGGDHGFLRYENGILEGQLQSHGPVLMREKTRHHFETQSPLDSAGEFQLRMTWTLNSQGWVWAFKYGLKGTPTRSGERHWHLTRKGKERGPSATQIIRNS